MATYRQKLITISGTCAVLGSNTIIVAPPAKKKILITFLKIQLGVVGEQTVIVKSNTTEIWNFIGDTLGAGEVEDFAAGEELPCGTAQPLIFELTAAKIVRYVVRYYVE